MKDIRLRRLRLLNFKGIRKLDITFSSGHTSIMANNGKGKTTVLDAFLWLLFGKDHMGRKPSGKSSFGLKTYDESGNIIPRIPHEVEAEIEYDGKDISLRRTFNEKWTKKRGETEEHFDGNIEERYFNEVPCNLEEWSEKISSVCPEETFNLITRVSCFNAMKMEAKRKMLIQMAGGVKDEEIASGNIDFMELLASLDGKTFDDYRKEVTAKKKKVNAKLKDIPNRIDERQRDIPEDESWDDFRRLIDHKESEINKIEELIISDAQKCEENNNARLTIAEKLHEVREQISQRSHALSDKAFAEYREYQTNRNALLDEKKVLTGSIKRFDSDYQSLKEELDKAMQRREKMLKEYDLFKARVKSIREEQIILTDNDFRCPTCGRTFEPEQISEKQAEMVSRFKAEKQKRIDAVMADIEENVSKGKLNTQSISEIEAEMNRCQNQIDEARRRLSEIDNSEGLKKIQTPPDARSIIDSDEIVKKLREDESRLESKFREGASAVVNEELSARRKVLRSEIDDLRQRLGKQDDIKRSKERIVELENQLRQLNQELATLEKTEAVMAAFAKAKIEAIEDKINSMFSIVKFKLFDTQINGAEVETCEATLNGVPYLDCSNAEKINMGVDIINTISRFRGIRAPVFIDNAESVVRLLPTESQVVRLEVSPDDKELTVFNTEV